jgi:hypothetical protein
MAAFVQVPLGDSAQGRTVSRPACVAVARVAGYWNAQAQRLRSGSAHPTATLRRGRAFGALTGWGQEEDRRRSREAGFDVHLVKPIDPKNLNKILSDLASRASSLEPTAC